MRMIRRSLLILAACLIASGCSKSNTATVTGTVTVDGQAAKSGYVSFFAVDGRAPNVGARIVDGRYTAQVKPGLCYVQVRVPKEVGEKKLYDTSDSPVRKVMAESLPSKYNDATELQFDVKPGANESNYDLSTK
jgi:hypothetical protein